MIFGLDSRCLCSGSSAESPRSVARAVTANSPPHCRVPGANTIFSRKFIIRRLGSWRDSCLLRVDLERLLHSPLWRLGDISTEFSARIRRLFCRSLLVG